MPDNTVSNTPDAEYILVSKDNLLYFWLKLTLIFADKVDKEAGKGLSTEDFTTALKDKLVGLTEFSGDYADLTSKPSIAGVELVGAKTRGTRYPAGWYLSDHGGSSVDDRSCRELGARGSGHSPGARNGSR